MSPYARSNAAPNSEDAKICLFFFKPLKNNPEDTGRSFSVQIQRAFEYRDIGEYIPWEISYPVEEVVERQKHRKAGKHEEKIDQRVLDAEKALSLHGASILGIFEDSPVSLGFTMTMEASAETDNNITKAKRVYAIMMMPIGVSLIELYADTEYDSDADRQWAEKAVRAWRKSILALNPPVEGDPPISPFDGVEPFSLVGGILGALVSVFVILLQRAEKRRGLLKS